MSIRQQRYNLPQTIRENIATYKGKKITLVLANQTSVLGELITVEDASVTLKTYVNAWPQKRKIPFGDIKELYYDQVV